MTRFCKVLATVFLHFYAAGFSQTQSGDSTQRAVELEEVVVYAVRAGNNLPVSEVTMTKTEIQRNYTGQELPVMAARTPSVTWYSDGGHYAGYAYMRLRGIDQTRINFTLNGIPLNEPEDQGVYFSNYPDFSNNLHSLQIQRGVGTSTNGSAAYAGAINFESPSLREPAGAGIQASYGSYNTWQISPMVNSGLLKNKMAFYARYSNIGTDGFRQHSGTLGQTFFFSGGYFGKRSVLKLTAFSGRAKNQMSYLAVSAPDLKNDYRLNYLRDDEKDEFRQTLTMLQYAKEISSGSTLTSSLYYNHLNGNYDVYFDPDMLNFALKSDFGGLLVNYHLEKENLRVDGGFHANLYQRYHFLRVRPDLNTNLYLNNGRKREASTFAKVLYTRSKLSLFADLQLRTVSFQYTADQNVDLQFDNITWIFFNPKVGVSYQLRHVHLYFSSGRNGREPTRNDMLAGYDNIDAANYDEVGDFGKVKPEFVTDFEAGAKMNSPKLHLDVNLYSMYFNNEIAAIGQLSYIGLPLRKNVRASYRRGIEVNGVFFLLQHVTSATNVNLSFNRILEYTSDVDNITYRNVDPLLTPQALLNQSVRYQIARRIEPEIGFRYTSRSYLTNTGDETFAIPSSLIFNASLNIKFLKRHKLTIIANNITNEKYYTAGYVQSNESHYFAMALRNYYVSTTLSF